MSGCAMGFGGPAIGWLPLGGAAGGAGGVDSFNTRTGDVVPQSGDYTATQVTSTGPGADVQAGLDLLAPITSAAQLEARFPAAGGVHQIDQGVKFQLLPGSTEIDIGVNQIELVFPVRLEGFGSKVPIRSAVDGATIFGEGSIDNIIVQNVSFGASAKCISLGSASGKVIEVTNCALVGQDPGVISTSVAGSIVRNVAIIPLADAGKPLKFDGVIDGLIVDKMTISTIGPTPRTGIQVLATATISGVGFDRILFKSNNVGDALLDINNAVTLPVDETIGTLACSVIGPGALFKVGSLGAASPLITSTSQRGGQNSRWLGDVAFVSTTPIILTQTGSPTWDVMPFENVGPTASLTANALNQRFDLVQRALQDWGVEGRGRTDKKFGFISWTATVARSGGGAVRSFTGRVESRPDGISAWVEVPETGATIEMAGASPATIGRVAPFEWDKTAEFRLVTQGAAATDTAVFGYSLAPNAD